jgi:hypothetical protein
MSQELTVGKLMLNIEEGFINVRQALEYAYAAGYDKRGMDLNSHKIKKVTKFSVYGGKVKDYESISQAAHMNGISRDTVGDIIRGKRRLTPDKQYYFRYADNLTINK